MTALQRGIPVIPVLVDGAALPKREELPESLKRLLDWQSLDVDETRFDYDVERLYSALHPLVRRGSSIRGRPVLALAAVAAAVVATLIILSTLKLEMVPTQGPSQPNRKSGTTPVDSVRLQRIGPPLPGALLPTSQSAQIQFELTYVLESADQAFLGLYAEEFRGASGGCNGPHRTNGGTSFPIVRGEHYASVKVPWPGSSDSGFLGVGANFFKSVDGREAEILKSFGLFS
jgi:hypothetical protein